jgi:hypothetical protein
MQQPAEATMIRRKIVIVASTLLLLVVGALAAANCSSIYLQFVSQLSHFTGLTTTLTQTTINNQCWLDTTTGSSNYYNHDTVSTGSGVYDPFTNTTCDATGYAYGTPAATGNGSNMFFNQMTDGQFVYGAHGVVGCTPSSTVHTVTDSCIAKPCASNTCGSPIAIDLTGNGIVNNLSSSEDGTAFDLKGDGHPQWYAWQRNGDEHIGWLAMVDEHGQVPNGKWLLGNYTPNDDCPNPDKRNGWQALGELDEKDKGGNGDGFLTSADAAWSRMRVWVDANHDGIAQPSELRTLEEVGISSIGFSFTETKIADVYGNWYRFKGHINPLGRPPGSHVNPVAYDIYLSSRKIIQPPTGGKSSPGPINPLCCPAKVCGIAPK